MAIYSKQQTVNSPSKTAPVHMPYFEIKTGWKSSTINEFLMPPVLTLGKDHDFERIW